MKKIKYFYIALLILILMNESIIAGETGGQPGAFLRRGVGSSALAMGNAYTSVASDASALYWNPAGISEIKQRELFGMFSVLTFDRQQVFLSFGYNFSDLFSAAIGWNKFGVNNIDGRDAVGNSTEKFNDSENSIMLALSKQFGIISVGITGKYLNHSLFDKSATGFGFDVGMRARFLEMINIGLVIQDVASQLKWNTQSGLEEKIPLNVRGGVSFQPSFLSGIASVELSKVGENDLVFRVGAEYRIVEFFGIRVGYDGDNISFGGMVKPPFDLLNFQLDYAATRDVLVAGYVHHITLKFEF